MEPEELIDQLSVLLRRHKTGEVEVDRERRLVAEQGGWWYRGEYQVESDSAGSRLTFRVRNIAPPSSRWMVPLANKFFVGFRERATEEFYSFIRSLS